MRIYPKRTVSTVIVILSYLFLVSIMGCGSEKNTVVSFPENYAAEGYLLSDDYLAITAFAVRDNIFFYSVIKDISGNETYDADTFVLVGELLYIDFSAESASPISVQYYVKDNNIIIKIFSSEDGTLYLVTQSYGEIKESGVPEITETLIKKVSLNGEEILSYSIMEDVKNHWLGIDGFETAAFNVETGTLKTGHPLRLGQIYLDMASGTNSDLL